MVGMLRIGPAVRGTPSDRPAAVPGARVAAVGRVRRRAPVEPVMAR